MMKRVVAWSVLGMALLTFVSACSDDKPLEPVPNTATVIAATPDPTLSPMPRTELGKQTSVKWIWDSGLFNVVIWVRASDRVIAATYGGLYQPPNNFSPQPGGIALLNELSGAELWRKETETQAFPAAFVSDLVVFGTGNGTVYALDRASGAERWRLEFDGIPYQVINAAGVLVLADADPETWGPNGLVDKARLGGRVWGVDPATGNVIWKKTVGSFNAFVATKDGLVVASASTPGGDGQTVVFEAQTAKELWKITLEASSPPAINGDLVIVPNARMSAFEARTGKPKWQAEPKNSGTFFSPEILGKEVVAASNTGSLELLDAGTGALLAFAESGECGGQWFDFHGQAYGLLCGGIVRLERSAAGWKLVTVLIPQGAVDSLAPAGDALVFSTGIGSSPEKVILLAPD